MTSEHPTQAVLLQFLRQELGEDQAREVDAHISSCSDCEPLLAQLAGGLPWVMSPMAQLVGDPTLHGAQASTHAEGPAPSPAPALAVPGYEVLGVVGRGGMGIVYKAKQAGLGRLVALKVLQGGVGADEEERRRFKTEAEAVA